MEASRFALFGAGFWARYQLAGWRELPGAVCVAICDPVRSKAEKLAAEFGIPNVYDHPEKLLERESLDFIDIVAGVEAHASLVSLGIRRKLPVICQKPLAQTYETAQELTAFAAAAGIPLLVHENWRWQAPLRRLQEIIVSGRLGKLVRARIDFSNSFPVFNNQPSLKKLKQFILADVGVHLLDTTRFLFGESTELYCQTRRMHPDIAGEDVATVMLRTRDDVTVTCSMSYASHGEFDRFPETFVAIEGTGAGVTLGAEYEIKIFDQDGIHSERVAVPTYPWADPQYLLVHSSIVACLGNLLGSLRGECPAETTAEDNLKTSELVFAAYRSAETQQSITIRGRQTAPNFN